MNARNFLLAALLVLPAVLLAEPADPQPGKQPDVQPPKQPAKQGLKWTGLPLPSYNDDDGFGFGLRAYATFYEEGFAPFRWQVWAQIYKTTKARENHEIKADILNFFGTPYRVVIRGGFVRYQSAQYYGVGNFQDMQRNRSIQEGRTPINENVPTIANLNADWQETPLNPGFDPDGEIQLNRQGARKLHASLAGSPQTFNQTDFNPGRRVLRERQNKYFKYDRVEPYGQVSTEDWVGKTNFKWWVSALGRRYRIQSFQGDFDDGEAEANSATLIDIDRPTGYDALERRRYVNLGRVALVYDSRPRIRENDPNEGIFADAHFAGSDPAFGSDYKFSKVTLTWRHYLDVTPGLMKSSDQELVFAYRLQGQQTFGDAPFFELGRIYTKNEESEGLGGTYGLRGYASNQFVDNVMAMANLEVRWTFSKKPKWLGGMNWVLLGYYDAGRVAPTRGEMNFSEGIHKAAGAGLRLVWQTNTVVNVSSGRSKYESFTAFSFGHMF